MNEHALRDKVRKTLRKLPDVVVWKNWGTRYGDAGRPDMEIFFVGNVAFPRVLLVELKSPDKPSKPTAIQQACHEELRKVGYEVLVATSVEQILARMKAMGYEHA